MCLHDLQLLILREVHGLEDHSDKVDLDTGVIRHEIAHYDVFEVFQVDAVGQLAVELFGLQLVVRHELVVLCLQLV